jgi:hypothetical protein
MILMLLFSLAAAVGAIHFAHLLLGRCCGCDAVLIVRLMYVATRRNPCSY